MTTAPTDRSPFRPGDILANKYAVEEVLGAGGMGIVVAATHVQLKERVALKFLLPEFAKDQTLSARFLREAQSAVRIKSEHVARIIDVGTLDGGEPYMVMEHLVGTDLAKVLEREGPLRVDVATSYLLQAAEAIAQAHMLGIIHRDLKPSNLFLSKRVDGSPLIKVLDFGISKDADAEASSALTATSAFLGSPQYMSPEQAKSAKTADARSDVWSFGVCLYELLTGECPFDGESATELLANILNEAPVPPRARRPDLPPDLEATILACLEKDRARRIGSIVELAERLAPHASAEARASVSRIATIQGPYSRTERPPPPAPPSGAVTPKSFVEDATVSDPNVSQAQIASGTTTPAATRTSLPRALAALAIIAVGLVVSIVAFVEMRGGRRSDPIGHADPETTSAFGAGTSSAAPMPAIMATTAPSVEIAAAPTPRGASTASATTVAAVPARPPVPKPSAKVTPPSKPAGPTPTGDVLDTR